MKNSAIPQKFGIDLINLNDEDAVRVMDWILTAKDPIVVITDMLAWSHPELFPNYSFHHPKV